MKKLLISVTLLFLSLNINAAISQSGITDLKQLNGNQLKELISGNKLTGFISEKTQWLIDNPDPNRIIEV